MRYHGSRPARPDWVGIGHERYAMPTSWTDATLAAVRRQVARTGDPVFTRRQFIDAELPRIVAETGSSGVTPAMTLSRELQQLRDAGFIQFVDQGTYRWVGDAAAIVQPGSSKGVFVVGSHSIYADEPERFYRFGPRWMTAAAKVVGHWIVYQEPNIMPWRRSIGLCPIRRRRACTWR